MFGCAAVESVPARVVPLIAPAVREPVPLPMITFVVPVGTVMAGLLALL